MQITLHFVGWSLSNQLKTLREKERDFPRKKEFCLQMAFRLKLNITASLGLEPAGLPIELWLASSHTCESQFLKIKSLSIYTHILLVLFLWKILSSKYTKLLSMTYFW